MSALSKHIAHTTLLILFIISFGAAIAQQDASRMFKKYTTKDGLINNAIYSLQQSKNGMWWIATGNGLQRFDGYNFEHWNEWADSLDNVPSSSQFVYEDKTGNVWLINFTEHSVAPAGSRKIQKVETDPNRPIPYPDNMPIPVLEDNNRLWCYQSNTGFYGFNKSNLKIDTLVAIQYRRIVNKTLLPFPTVSSYENNSVWVSVDFEDSSYVTQLTPEKGIQTESFSNNQYGRIKGIIPINESEVLFISTSYTAICDNRDLKKPLRVLSTENIPGNFIRGLPYERLKANNPGSILFPGENGIYEYVPSQKLLRPYSTSLYPEINLSRQLMFAIKEDEWGNIWIGRDGSDGLLVYYPGKLKFKFLRAPAEYFNLVYSLAVTPDGIVYASHFQKGINLFNKEGVWKKHIPLPPVENDLSPSIRTINFFNSKQLLLKSLYGKLMILDLNTHEIKDLSSLIPAKVSAYTNVFDTNIYPVKDNESHYTNGRYIVRVTKSNNKYMIDAIDSLPESSRINSLTYSHEGKRIVGTGAGIYIKEKDWKLIPGTEKFIVKYITVDTNGTIWAVGPRGIITVEDNKVNKTYNESTGLLNEFIYGVLFDDHGNAWYSSNRGIGCIFKNGSIRFFTEADGLQGDEFDTQSFWKGTDGKLYFGGIQGITSFYPEEVLQSAPSGQLQLSGIQVNEENYPASGRIEAVNELNLPHDKNSLTFHFTLTNFSDTKYNVYQVKLDGRNKEWINLKNVNSIKYLLVPGKYTLRVKGSSDGSNWSKEKQIPIIIHPAWWQTNLFRWSLGLLALGLIGFGTWYYNKIKTKELKQQLALEVEMQKERERISRDLHDHIGAYSTALIANADALEQQIDDEKTLKTLSYLKENSKNILATLRETIWLLNSSNLTIKRFYEGFINYSTNILRNHEGIEIEFTDEITNNAQLQPAKAIHLLRILQEAIQNIAKHAQATRIICHLACHEQLTISITDNGKGFDIKQIRKGNGLYNMQKRTEEINFVCDIKSTPGEGTTLTITGIV